MRGAERRATQHSGVKAGMGGRRGCDPIRVRWDPKCSEWDPTGQVGSKVWWVRSQLPCSLSGRTLSAHRLDFTRLIRQTHAQLALRPKAQRGHWPHMSASGHGGHEERSSSCRTHAGSADGMGYDGIRWDTMGYDGMRYMMGWASDHSGSGGIFPQCLQLETAGLKPCEKILTSVVACEVGMPSCDGGGRRGEVAMSGVEIGIGAGFGSVGVARVQVLEWQGGVAVGAEVGVGCEGVKGARGGGCGGRGGRRGRGGEGLEPTRCITGGK